MIILLCQKNLFDMENYHGQGMIEYGITDAD